MLASSCFYELTVADDKCSHEFFVDEFGLLRDILRFLHRVHKVTHS